MLDISSSYWPSGKRIYALRTTVRNIVHTQKNFLLESTVLSLTFLQNFLLNGTVSKKLYTCRLVLQIYKNSPKLLKQTKWIQIFLYLRCDGMVF
jgi:hypothetical protein